MDKHGQQLTAAQGGPLLLLQELDCLAGQDRAQPQGHSPRVPLRPPLQGRAEVVGIQEGQPQRRILSTIKAVPSLLAPNGEILIESMAICEYLE